MRRAGLPVVRGSLRAAAGRAVAIVRVSFAGRLRHAATLELPGAVWSPRAPANWRIRGAGGRGLATGFAAAGIVQTAINRGGTYALVRSP
jgi:hypothetical protein